MSCNERAKQKKEVDVMKKAIWLVVAFMFLITGGVFAQETPSTAEQEEIPKLKVKVAGGVQTYQEITMGEHHPVDNFLRGSIFVKGVVNPKLGFFFHAMYLYYPQKEKIMDFFIPVGFVWWNPNKYINLKVGSLKKPGEYTFLGPWFFWTFETTPQIYGTLSKEKLCFVDTGIQLNVPYKKLVNLQLNIFRTEASLSKKFNLQYYLGLKVTPAFGDLKPGVAVFYNFEPHYGFPVSYQTNTPVDMTQRKGLLAAAWVNFKGARLFVEYIQASIKGKVIDKTSTGYDVELSYAYKFKGITFRPKVRYDYLDPTKNSGDSTTAIIPGIDFILAQNPKTKFMYKAAIEYQINKEEQNETKNDVIRLVLQLGGF